MNLIKTIRKPYLSILLAILMVFSSCSQYDDNISEETESNTKFAFNYDIYNELISKDIARFDSVKKTNLTDIENRKLTIEAINAEYNTDLKFNKAFLELQNHSVEEIFHISLANSWITNHEINIINKFGKDIKSNDFNKALNNMENNILDLDLSDEEFKKYNFLVNIVKVIEYDFVARNSNNGILPADDFDCWMQAISVAATGYGFATACVTPAVVLVAPCIFATAQLLVATTKFDNCMNGL